MIFILYLYIYTFEFYQASTRKVLKSTLFQYSILLEYFWNIDTLLYSSNHFHLNTLLLLLVVVKFQYFTQHW